MMALKINNPVFIDNYERYRIELEAWREITELPKAKQGIAVALSLPLKVVVTFVIKFLNNYPLLI